LLGVLGLEEGHDLGNVAAVALIDTVPKEATEVGVAGDGDDTGRGTARGEPWNAVP
jgi:hypothetical protein